MPENVSEFSYNFTSQQGIINIILLISAIIQTALFVYHYWKHDRTSTLPHIHEYLEIFAVVFFIVAIVLSEIQTSWNQWMMFDVTLQPYNENIDDKYNYIVPWTGVFMILLGNILFYWIELYLDIGIQAPLFLNDISIHNIDINISNISEQQISLIITENMNDADKSNKSYWNDKELVTRGPYSWCRHPIYLVWASWEFGYLLCTGHWFEYLSFTLFIVVEALRVDIIDKSLLYRYRQIYVDYAANNLHAFFPTFIGEYICYIDLAFCSCCFIECKRFTEYQMIRQSDKHIDEYSKHAVLLINDKINS